MLKFKSILFAAFVIFISGCSSNEIIRQNVSLQNKITQFKNDFADRQFSFQIPSGSKIDTVIIDSINKSIQINLNKQFSYQAFREDNSSIKFMRK